MSINRKIRIGILSFYDEGYSEDVIKKRISKNLSPLRKLSDVRVVFENNVTNYPNAKDTALQIKDKNIDCLIVIIASWTESRCIFENIQYYLHKPILIWATTGIVDNDNILNSPAPIGGAAPIVFNLKYFTNTNFKFIRDSHEKGIALDEALAFIRTCGCISQLKNMKIGIMGTGTTHTYTFNFDSVSLKREFGIEIEDIDLLDLIKLINSYEDKDIKIERELFEKSFDVEIDLRGEVFLKTIKLYKSLKEIVKNYAYNAIMLNCFQFGENLGVTLCLPFTLLGDEIPCKGGSDVMSAVTQLILRCISRKISTYLEVFEQMGTKRLLMSSCGYAPKSLCINKKILCDCGKWGDVNLPGLKNCSQMKEGIVTIARLSYAGSKYVMHLAKGFAKKPRPYKELDMNWSKIDKMPCTPGLELELVTSTADDFLDNLVSSHYDIVYGDYVDELINFCELKKISYIL